MPRENDARLFKKMQLVDNTTNHEFLYLFPLLTGLNIPTNPTRRDCLRLAAVAGITIAACAPVPLTPLPGTPATPTPRTQILPPVIVDRDYPQDRRERAAQLIQGTFPESWKNLSDTELLNVLNIEMRQTVIPEFIHALGGNVNDVNNIINHLHFANSDEDFKRLLIEVSKLSEDEADLIVQRSIGNTSVGIDSSNGKTDLLGIIINVKEGLNEAYYFQQELVEQARLEDKPLYNSREFFLFTFIRDYFDSVLHETTHVFKQGAYVFNPRSSTIFQQIFQNNMPIGVNVTPYPDQFISSYGMGVKYENDGNSGMIYRELNEMFRAYIQELGIRRIMPDSQRHLSNIFTKRSIYINDVTRFLFIEALNHDLEIDDDEFFEAFIGKPINLISVMQFYTEHANRKDIGINQKDLVSIFNSIDFLSHQYVLGNNDNLKDYLYVGAKWPSISNQFIKPRKGKNPLPLQDLQPKPKPVPVFKPKTGITILQSNP